MTFGNSLIVFHGLGVTPISEILEYGFWSSADTFLNKYCFNEGDEVECVVGGRCPRNTSLAK